MKSYTLGGIYCYIHFIIEIACFYILSTIIKDGALIWIIAFIYDALAFVPQSIIGAVSDRFPKIPIGIMGVSLLIISIILFSFQVPTPAFIFFYIVLLCLGNALLHIAGAETTLRTAKGKLTPSSIFVAGGAFGVVVGNLLSGIAPIWFVFILLLTLIPFVLLTERTRKQVGRQKSACQKFCYNNPKIPASLLIILILIVVVVRSYMGYSIPTSWNKSIMETILLGCAMGIGKALGGILSDKIGLRKTAVLSTIGALPFLIFGDQLMLVSLIGIMLFSMTMAITIALLVSTLKQAPGLAFGVTTIGLFIGMTPCFFIKFGNTFSSSLFIIIATIISLFILLLAIKKKGRHA